MQLPVYSGIRLACFGPQLLPPASAVYLPSCPAALQHEGCCSNGPLTSGCQIKDMVACLLVVGFCDDEQVSMANPAQVGISPGISCVFLHFHHQSVNQSLQVSQVFNVQYAQYNSQLVKLGISCFKAQREVLHAPAACCLLH
eukprot:GHRR01036781.1.p1 GENE.GHRR01036781.1~~GHRR01036781.1.p1  ORF type:complete len:142 (-),score=37.03 GHRR01036781.1:1217-1642(-)